MYKNAYGKFDSSQRTVTKTQIASERTIKLNVELVADLDGGFSLETFLIAKCLEGPIPGLVGDRSTSYRTCASARRLARHRII